MIRFLNSCNPHWPNNQLSKNPNTFSSLPLSLSHFPYVYSSGAMTMEDLLGESASLSATAASACFVTLCSVDEADGDVAECGI